MPCPNDNCEHLGNGFCWLSCLLFEFFCCRLCDCLSDCSPFVIQKIRDNCCANYLTFEETFEEKCKKWSWRLLGIPFLLTTVVVLGFYFSLSLQTDTVDKLFVVLLGFLFIYTTTYCLAVLRIFRHYCFSENSTNDLETPDDSVPPFPPIQNDD